MGELVKLARPLEFLAVTGRSDGLGFFPQLMAADRRILADPQGRKWYNITTQQRAYTSPIWYTRRNRGPGHEFRVHAAASVGSARRDRITTLNKMASRGYPTEGSVPVEAGFQRP